MGKTSRNCIIYLDNIPSHYYMEYLYKYPQKAISLRTTDQENRHESKMDPEFEILDTGVFDDDEYFDVTGDLRKENAKDIFIRIDITNRQSQSSGYNGIAYPMVL